MSHTKVPWEPYKAATNTRKPNLIDLTKSDSNFLKSSQIEKINQASLIRYKVATDLNIFNAARPGYQFNDFDLKLIENKAVNETSVKEITESGNFLDARFYPDLQFLKLANDLKKKCLESSGLKAQSTKPVSIVAPLVERKVNKEICQTIEGASTMKMLRAQITRNEHKIEFLEEQLKGFNEQLQIQTQVNAELKKLLVASIGEDVQYKMERLISDKLRLEIELENYSKQIEKINEEMEQVSIRCDLWRSKFLACRMMSDEASAWKAFLLLLNQQNDKVLKNIISDNELLNEKLNQALNLLDEINSTNESSQPKRNLSNLTAASSLMSGLLLIKNRNSQSLNNFKIDNRFKTKTKTLNETIAAQMLEQFDWLRYAIQSPNVKNVDANPEFIDSFEKLESLIARIKISKSTIHSRLYQLTEVGQVDLFVNICNSCKGHLKVV